MNERLLIVRVGAGQDAQEVNIAEAIIEIIDKYVETKRSAFKGFIEACKRIASLSPETSRGAVEFVEGQLQPHVDARVFEIVSFAIMKAHYGEQSIFWGWSANDLRQDFLML